MVGRIWATGDDSGAPSPVGHPQHQVGEGQVGEQLPVGDQQVQPLQVRVSEGGVLAYEVVQAGHPPSLQVCRDFPTSPRHVPHSRRRTPA